MTLALTHAFVSPKGDGVDPTRVQPTNWNDEHVITMATARLIGRTTSGAGDAEEISVGAGLTLAAGTLSNPGALPIGTVIDFAGTVVPAGFVVAGGQAISRTTYALLYAAIGTTYGVGDGVTTFNVPDCCDRVVAGLDTHAKNRLTSPVNGNTLGATGGTEGVSLIEAELAAHNHSFSYDLAAHTHTWSDTVDDHQHYVTMPGVDHKHYTSLQMPNHYHNVSIGVTVTGSGTTAAGGLHQHAYTDRYTIASGNAGYPDGPGGGLFALSALTELEGSHTHTFNVTSTGGVNGVTSFYTVPHGFLNSEGYSLFSDRALTSAAWSGNSNAGAQAIGGTTSSSGGATVAGNTGNKGSGTAHNNVQPTIVLFKLIYAGV